MHPTARANRARRNYNAAAKSDRRAGSPLRRSARTNNFSGLVSFPGALCRSARPRRGNRRNSFAFDGLIAEMLHETGKENQPHAAHVAFMPQGDGSHRRLEVVGFAWENQRVEIRTCQPGERAQFSRLWQSAKFGSDFCRDDARRNFHCISGFIFVVRSHNNCEHNRHWQKTFRRAYQSEIDLMRRHHFIGLRSGF